MGLKLVSFYTLLALTLLLIACTPSAAEPTAVPPNDNNLPVQIRLQNDSRIIFEQIELIFPEETAVFPTLAPNQISDYRGFQEAFQSVEIVVTADEGRQTLTLPAYDIEFEKEFPITAGSYTLRLTLPENRLQADWQPEQPEELTELMSDLEAGVFAVGWQPSIKRQTIFDELFGKVVSQREILLLNDSQLEAFIFADDAAAQAAADTIQASSTILTHTRPDGETVSLTIDTMIGAQPTFWQHGRFLLYTTDPAIVESVSTALGTAPLNPQPLADGEIQVRLINLSDRDFDSVTVNFFDQAVEYGPLPSRGTSGYETAVQAYRYAMIQATVGDETFEFLPIDYVGEAPLTPGKHSYVLTIVDNYLNITHLADDELASDEALLGAKWEWVEAKTAVGEPFVIASIDQTPTLEFTTDPEPNGEGGYVLTGYTGCNSFFGSYWLSEMDSALVIPFLGQTEQGCEEAVAASEQFLTNALTTAVYYNVEGDTLTLNTLEGATLIFTKQ